MGVLAWKDGETPERASSGLWPLMAPPRLQSLPWPGLGSQRRLHPGAEPFSLFSVLPSQCLRSWVLTGYLRKRKGVTLFLHSNCLRPPKRFLLPWSPWIPPRSFRGSSGGLGFGRFISVPGSTALLSADRCV